MKMETTINLGNQFDEDTVIKRHNCHVRKGVGRTIQSVQRRKKKYF